MKINIGENIKRLRRERELTQEQLAEVLNVSITAVSKWERNETYPDITLLFPLAHYFGVSLDELMGYDREHVEQDISDAVKKYRELYSMRNIEEKRREAREFITETYKKYPNDYRVMSSYMWNVGGDYADNDPNVILEHKDEFRKICERLLDGCTDTRMRLDAHNMLGKILHAEGRTQEAIELYCREFPDWYQTSFQKTEQLFAKDTKEFADQLRFNMYSLAGFAINKKIKELWHCCGLDMAERIEKGIELIDGIRELRLKTDNAELCTTEFAAILELHARAKYFGGGEYVERAEELLEQTKQECIQVMKTNEPVARFLKYQYPWHFNA